MILSLLPESSTSVISVILPHVYPKVINMTGFSATHGYIYDATYTYNTLMDGWQNGNSDYTNYRLDGY